MKTGCRQLIGPAVYSVVVALALVAVPMAMLASSSAYAEKPAYRGGYITGKVVRETGAPVSGVEVRLADAKGVMMDVTRTNAIGEYKLDLGVLEEKELRNLDRFYIRVDDGRGTAYSRLIGGNITQGDGYLKFINLIIR